MITPKELHTILAGWPEGVAPAEGSLWITQDKTDAEHIALEHAIVLAEGWGLRWLRKSCHPTLITALDGTEHIAVGGETIGSGYTLLHAIDNAIKSPAR